jgi:prepilin-type N-terminal cleavage/methylation domain-containing protein
MHLRQDGFTLVELVVAMGLFGIFGALLFSVLVFSVGFTRRGAAEVESEQLVRIAMSTMVRELREAPASAVAIWPGVRGEPVRAVGFVSARQEAAGRRFTTDTSGSPVWQTAIFYVHDPSSASLRRIARPWDGVLTLPPAAEGRIVARGVQGMTIARHDDLITITLVVNIGRRERRLETAVQLRNQ